MEPRRGVIRCVWQGLAASIARSLIARSNTLSRDPFSRRDSPSSLSSPCSAYQPIPMHHPPLSIRHPNICTLPPFSIRATLTASPSPPPPPPSTPSQPPD